MYGQDHTFENILVRYNDWYDDSSNYLILSEDTTGKRLSPDFKRYDSHWRYVTIENSYSAGIFPGAGSLVEYARFENLYEGCDCSGIQRNAANTLYSTTRYSWMINAPGQNGVRFDTACGGTMVIYIMWFLLGREEVLD